MRGGVGVGVAGGRTLVRSAVAGTRGAEVGDGLLPELCRLLLNASVPLSEENKRERRKGAQRTDEGALKLPPP